MYARTIKITFKDTLSKDMFVNFTDTKADAKGIKNGTLLKFIFENSDTSATLVLVFPDFKTFKKDHDNLAGPIIESLRRQELKIELNDGPIVGNTAVDSNFLNILKKEAAFYE